MHLPPEDLHMESFDNFRERFEALEQQMKVMGAHTSMVKRRLRWWRLPRWVASIAALGLALAFPFAVLAKTFHCGAGDVACLIDAINAANANGTKNTIRLEAGTYTLSAPDNPGNGLPVITSPLSITGEGVGNTIIERDASAAAFRILRVAPTGTLTLQQLVLRSGRSAGGGGIRNEGTLALIHTTVTANVGGADEGGGIVNTGTLTLIASRVTENRVVFGGGGIVTGLVPDDPHDRSSVTLINSTVSGNSADFLGGGILVVGGTVTLIDSTISQNGADTGGGLRNGRVRAQGFDEGGTVWIHTSTVSHNRGVTAGGISNSGTLFLVQNQATFLGMTRCASRSQP